MKNTLSNNEHLYPMDSGIGTQDSSYHAYKKSSIDHMVQKDDRPNRYSYNQSSSQKFEAYRPEAPYNRNSHSRSPNRSPKLPDMVNRDIPQYERRENSASHKDLNDRQYVPFYTDARDRDDKYMQQPSNHDERSHTQYTDHYQQPIMNQSLD
jgi:hypothetical protein